jgi:hypothetical protein
VTASKDLRTRFACKVRPLTRWQKDPLLKIEHVTMRFGGLTAVDDVWFQVGRGDVTALIEPNGARQDYGVQLRDWALDRRGFSAHNSSHGIK